MLVQLLLWEKMLKKLLLVTRLYRETSSALLVTASLLDRHIIYVLYITLCTAFTVAMLCISPVKLRPLIVWSLLVLLRCAVVADVPCRADSVYNFFLQWQPDRYRQNINNEELLSSNGFIPIKEEDISDRIAELPCSLPMSVSNNQIYKDWEVCT